MKISLLHPSRGRPDKSFATTRKWLALAGAPCELIVSIDSDDAMVDKYISLYQNRIIVSPNRSVVDATNRAANMSSGDILIYLSDDFDCFEGWGQKVIAEFQKYQGPTLIKVDDCLQPFKVEVLTIPMMNRELYNKMSYFWHPGYLSMFVDCHLYHRAKRLHALRFAEHLKFEHRHVSAGKAQDDETYRRSAANWNQGKELFAKHQAAGFIV